MSPRKVKDTLSLVIEQQRAPRHRRMAESALRFARLGKLIEMHVLVARLTFCRDPLVFETLHPCHDLLFMTICTSDRKMLSNELKLCRSVVKTHGFPVRHGMTARTTEIRHEIIELSIVLVDMTCLASERGKSKHRFGLPRLLMTVIARHGAMRSFQREFRIVVLGCREQRRLERPLAMAQ